MVNEHQLSLRIAFLTLLLEDEVGLPVKNIPWKRFIYDGPCTAGDAGMPVENKAEIVKGGPTKTIFVGGWPALPCDESFRITQPTEVQTHRVLSNLGEIKFYFKE